MYSCQYQLLVRQYLDECVAARAEAHLIPFWPAPNNAPAACDCNLGRVGEYLARVEGEQAKCFGNLGEGDGAVAAAAVSSVSDTLNGLLLPPLVAPGVVAGAKKAAACACCGASAGNSACILFSSPSLPFLGSIYYANVRYNCPEPTISAPTPSPPSLALLFPPPR